MVFGLEIEAIALIGILAYLMYTNSGATDPVPAADDGLPTNEAPTGDPANG